MIQYLQNKSALTFANLDVGMDHHTPDLLITLSHTIQEEVVQPLNHGMLVIQFAGLTIRVISQPTQQTIVTRPN